MILYPIFSRRIAYRLESEGLTVVKIEKDKKNPNRNVYYFEDTLKLHAILTEARKRFN